MTEPVKRWHMPRGTSISEHEDGEFVLSTDYARLEQECETWKITAAGEMDRRDEMQAERDAALKQVEGLREALQAFTGAAYPVSHQINSRGYNWSQAYLDEALALASVALQAEPCAPTK
jgi:hypothetical protein